MQRYRSGLFVVLVCILVREDLAVLPPEIIGENKRRATYHFTLVIEDIAVSEASATEALDTCRVSGRIEEVHRKPMLRFIQPDGAPDTGALFTLSIPCWNKLKRPEPPGPNRLYHSGSTRPSRIEIWGSVIDEKFVTFEFEQID